MFELSQLRCFVAAADELHFGRAAARLNMTQPPLSRQIQLLERAVGAALLERTSRSVRVTPAGGASLVAGLRTLTRRAGAGLTAWTMAIANCVCPSVGRIVAPFYRLLRNCF